MPQPDLPCCCPLVPLVEPDIGFSPVRLSDGSGRQAYRIKTGLGDALKQGSEACTSSSHVRPTRTTRGRRSSDRFTLPASGLIKGPGFLWHVYSLSALMHLASTQLTQPKSGLTLETSSVVSSVNTSGPVRLPLPPSPVHLSHRFRFPAIHLGPGGNGAGLRFYIFLLSQHAATLTPGSS